MLVKKGRPCHAEPSSGEASIRLFSLASWTKNPQNDKLAFGN